MGAQDGVAIQVSQRPMSKKADTPATLRLKQVGVLANCTYSDLALAISAGPATRRVEVEHKKPRFRGEIKPITIYMQREAVMKRLKFAKSVLATAALSCCLFGVASAATLNLGFVGPLTGGGAPWGIAAAEAEKIIAADVNAKGGLDVGGTKYHINVIAYDDHYKAADSVAAYERLAHEDGVKFMIIDTSPAAMALKNNVERDHVLALTGAYAERAIGSDTKYMFRVYSTAHDYLPGLIRWMVKNEHVHSVVTINPNDATGWSQDKLTLALFGDADVKVLDHELYDRAQHDFQPLFTKVLAEKPNLIDLGSTPPATAGLMIRQARELGYKGQFAKTGGAGPEEIVKIAGKKAADGMVSMLYVDPTNPAYRKLAAQFKKDVGQAPNPILLPNYDAVNVLLHAIQKAGTVQNTAKVAAAFAKVLPMKSLSGDTLKLGGEADHQIMTTTYIGVIKKGVPVAVGKI